MEERKRREMLLTHCNGNNNNQPVLLSLPGVTLAKPTKQASSIHYTMQYACTSTIMKEFLLSLLLVLH